MWRALMDEALASLPKEHFTTPEPTPKDLKPVFRGVWQGYESFTIDTISGRLATEFTPPETQQEVFFPEVHEILYWVDKNDPWGDVPRNPSDDPQFKFWEYPIKNWLKTQYLPEPDKPSSYDNIHTPGNSPKIDIIDPQDGGTYDSNQKITVQIGSRGEYTLSKLDFYVNNTYLGTSSQSPFLFSFTPSQIENISRENILKIVATDAVFNRSEADITFEVSI
jgi:hypothetical protein